MAEDVRRGRINCVIVKNLARAFRNNANQGRFLEEFIPLYDTRFISLYEPAVDTFLNPESVHGIEVTITGFINEQYAYKTSVDVRRTFKYKMEHGEFIGAFAPYGYAKDPENKNALIIDEEAAQVVRDVYAWYVNEGMTKRGIVKRLNELGVLNPTAYKRAKGFRYHNPLVKENSGLWNAKTVADMLADPLYIGVMRQGRQRVVSYKVHERRAVPESEWYRVENALPPLIGRELFDAAQKLNARDVRTPPGKSEAYLFSGLVRCADCKKAMHRKSSKGYVYYCCRTYQDQSGSRCGKHTIRLDMLEQAVLASIRKEVELISPLSEILEEVKAAPPAKRESNRLEALHERKTRELEKATSILDGLFYDWKNGDVSREQYRRLKARSEEQAGRLRETLARLESEREAAARDDGEEDPYLAAFLKHRNIQSLSRGLLVDLVNAVYVHRDGSIDVEFNFADPYRRGIALIKSKKKDADGGSAVRKVVP